MISHTMRYMHLTIANMKLCGFLLLVLQTLHVTKCEVFTNPFSLREVLVDEAKGVANLMKLFRPKTQELKELVERYRKNV